MLAEPASSPISCTIWASPSLGSIGRKPCSPRRAKAAERGIDIRFLLGDAERTLEEKRSYDVIVTRHLVWTLVDPQAAFAEWVSLLKPGGQLLIVDGDFVTETWASRLRKNIEKLRTGKAEPTGGFGTDLREMHRSILSRVYFSQGARAEEVIRLLEEAGFEQPVIDKQLGAIHRAQAKHMGFFKMLERTTQYRYAICVRRSNAEPQAEPARQAAWL